MGKLIVDVSPSVDGYIAGAGVGVEAPFGEAGMRLHRWMGEDGSVPTAHDREAFDRMYANCKAIVLGRRMFDVGIGPWGDDGAFHRPCFVVTHRAESKLVRGPTTFTFETDGVASAVEAAHATAGDADVLVVGGADIIQQCLFAGFVDEIRLHVVPVLLGSGTRLFARALPESVELECIDEVATPFATHVTFRVAGTPVGQSSPDRAASADRFVRRGPYRLHVTDSPGEGPAIVLMHGFPDNHHLYDRLVPHLRGRRVVTFDFLGWGDSDKPAPYDYTFANQVGDLDAVINGLGLTRVVLVVHDASGPAGINWALNHPQRVAGLVALNTFYSFQSDLPPNPPEAIRLFSDPSYARLTAHFAESPREFRWLYDFQVGGFILDRAVRNTFVPLLYRQFTTTPSTLDAFLALNRDLNAAVFANTQRVPELGTFPVPVRFAFGELDRYLSPDLARSLAACFGRAEVSLIPNAGHFPQLDAPHDTANAILTTPLAFGDEHSRDPSPYHAGGE